jgi:hypothetical protein
VRIGGDQSLGRLTNSTYKMAYVLFSKRKLCKTILLIVDFALFLNRLTGQEYFIFF